MHPYKRSRRVSELLKEALARILQNNVSKPDLGMTTVTGVDLTDDLRSARVYVSVLGGQEVRDRSMKILNDQLSHIRHLLGKSVRLRYVPELQFKYDDTYDSGERIDAILERIREEENG